MPQFNFAHFIPQMAWLAFFFAVLYFVVVRATLPKLGRVMQAREDKVMGDLEVAHAAKAAADGVSAANQAALLKAQDEARAQVAAARATAQAAIVAQLADVDTGIHAKLEAAQAVLETARAKAAGEIEAIAADAAGAIVERLTGTRPADEQASAAARAALA